MKKTDTSLPRRPDVRLAQSRPLATPIYPAVAYRAPTPDALDDIYEGRENGFTYARDGHPNAQVLAQKIDAMEGADGGIVTSSGMSALSAVLLGCLKSGDHIVGGDQLYGRSLRLLTEDFQRMGFATDLADPTNAEAIQKAIRPQTRLIIVEVVSNPTLRIADITAISKLAAASGALLVIDNTFTTPRGFKPLENGADIVFHSVTKLLAGHADATLGYVAAKDADLQQNILDASVTFGLTPSPFDSWLAERGLQSFDLRFERAQNNAAALADHLAGIDGVERVIYPGRSDHPDHDRAAELLVGGFGNMVSFVISGGRDAANAMTSAAEGLPFAPTLGDIATTLSHPLSSSHRSLSPSGQKAIGLSEGFFRISVGVEDIDLLKAEFSEAVKSAVAG